MSEVGQSLPYRAFRAMSGLLPAATELRTSRVVRFVPKSEVANFIQLPPSQVRGVRVAR